MEIPIDKSSFGRGIHLVSLRPSSTPEQFLTALSFENVVVDVLLDPASSTPSFPEADGLDCISYVLPSETKGKEPPIISAAFKRTVLDLTIPVFIFSQNAPIWIRRMMQDAYTYLDFNAATMSGHIIKSQGGAIGRYHLPVPPSPTSSESTPEA